MKLWEGWCGTSMSEVTRLELTTVFSLEISVIFSHATHIYIYIYIHAMYDITIYNLYRKTAKIHCHIYHIILSCRMEGVSEENAKMLMFFYNIAFEF